MFKTIHIETERLLIRPFTLADLPAFHAMVSHPEVMAFLPEDIMSLEEAKGILSWLIESYAVNTREAIRKFTVAVVHRNSGKIIGWVGLGPLEFEPTEIELSYGISQEHWGNGFATEAALAMLEYGFDVVGLERIVAVTHPENIASVRVLEKIGMARESIVTGLSKEHAFYESSLLFMLHRDQ
jgi:ribosomal-protein-alanine N-acetyltransferase